ncbi:hypothetical protein LCGC14_2495860 [marine sediment metagenome]|uniref:Uncharacterized protein n=1 Tax=marine sediment metagenome TaxID=412755 RepID=A0A0F9BRB7_9ZZZZ
MNTVNAQCTGCEKSFEWKDQLVPILCPDCRSYHLKGNIHTHGNVDPAQTEAFLRSIGRWIDPEVTI